jgi:hypothetical protein
MGTDPSHPRVHSCSPLPETLPVMGPCAQFVRYFTKGEEKIQVHLQHGFGISASKYMLYAVFYANIVYKLF